MMPSKDLVVRDLHAWQGNTPVLRGVNLTVAAGQTVALLGRNGSGRSTTAQALMGLVRAQGQVLWQGRDWLGQPTHTIARAGLGYVPEHKDIFPSLSVQENLMLGLRASTQRRYWDFDTGLAHFPILAERRHTPAGRLSGGEQQRTAIARALFQEPDLYLADEPISNLDTYLTGRVLGRLRQEAAQQGRTVFCVLHDPTLVDRFADLVVSIDPNDPHGWRVRPVRR